MGNPLATVTWSTEETLLNQKKPGDDQTKRTTPCMCASYRSFSATCTPCRL